MKLKPNHIAIGLVVAVFLGFMIYQAVAERPGATETKAGVITRTIGVVDTNASATFDINLLEGGDAEHESIHIFEGLQNVPGLGDVLFDTNTLQLTIEFDDATVDEDALRLHLVSLGYVSMTMDDATPTEVAADGSVQRISIGDTGLMLDPALIAAQAGVPMELDFAPGQECRVTIKIPAVGIEQDISSGGVVYVPALEPGEYQILCSGDGHEGSIFVE